MTSMNGVLLEFVYFLKICVKQETLWKKIRLLLLNTVSCVFSTIVKNVLTMRPRTNAAKTIHAPT